MIIHKQTQGSGCASLGLFVLFCRVRRIIIRDRPCQKWKSDTQSSSL